jgi:hypothetical protein
MNIHVSCRGLRRTLLIVWACVIGLGLASELSYYVFDFAPLARRVQHFSLSYETNLPTWYSSSLLFLAGVILAVIATEKSRARDRFRLHWWALALVFVYVSLDEAISLHEDWGGWTRAGGVLYFDWVIPGTILAVIMLIAYARFLWRLGPRTRDAFVLAGACYVGGALGVEFFLGYWSDLHGVDNLGYALIDFVEESLEILGVSLFIAALVDYAAAYGTQLRIGASADGTHPERSADPDAPAATTWRAA